MHFVPLTLILLSVAAAPRTLFASDRLAATFPSHYEGRHPDLYAQQSDRVRLLVRQAQLEVSSQLGLLQYQEGFRSPLTVRFDDRPKAGLEHALAYVRLMSSEQGPAQELVVNLDVMDKGEKDFDTIFYHEMTHAVLNDAVVANTHTPLPSWVQEGLAVFISGEGKGRVTSLAQRYRKSQVHAAVHDLDEPILDYSRNYLAFKFLSDKYSINAVQAFVRNLTQGMPPQEAIEESSGMTWDAFREKLKAYSLEAYRQEAQPDF